MKIAAVFEELIVWQEARKFRQTIDLLVKSFPADERYRLVDQLIRAITDSTNTYSTKSLSRNVDILSA
ncbi:four helix bundle protein [Spirosoma foliorum]|uniref:Four helix bundle protein n=1 Tax=Spirosoma foliorum TaxID=2710596 RepID=A0A7G5GR15_9BACT|nr:four helix bundle protein [Spirosoma foliorum]